MDHRPLRGEAGEVIAGFREAPVCGAENRCGGARDVFEVGELLRVGGEAVGVDAGV